jgi:hypothetical protein
VHNKRVTPYHRLFPKRARRAWLWTGAALLLAAIVCGALIWGLRVKGVISSSGGIYFMRPVALNVPPFRQGDPRWRDEPLGDTTDTIGSAGCALTSAAMILKWYGADTDPHRLNDYLAGHHGYVDNGLMVWEKAAKTGRNVKKVYEDLPSYWRIDSQLIKGNPVIVRLHFPGGGTHFVVIAGKRGFDYLILDPGGGWSKGLYPLREITPTIDGLRYFRHKTAS